MDGFPVFTSRNCVRPSKGRPAVYLEGKARVVKSEMAEGKGFPPTRMNNVDPCIEKDSLQSICINLTVNVNVNIYLNVHSINLMSTIVHHRMLLRIFRQSTELGKIAGRSTNDDALPPCVMGEVTAGEGALLRMGQGGV